MKIKYLLAVITLFLFNISANGQVEWQQQLGPRGRANLLYADNSIIFSTIDRSRIYISFDSGESWEFNSPGIGGNLRSDF